MGTIRADSGYRSSRQISDDERLIVIRRPKIAHGPVVNPCQSTFTGRTSAATADLLGQLATVFPSHHGGFLGGESGYAGQPEAFARKLREVLDDDN